MEKDHLAELESATLNSHVAAAHGNVVGEGPKTPTNTSTNADATPHPAEDSAAMDVDAAPVDKPVTGATNTPTRLQPNPDDITSTSDGETGARGEVGGPENNDSESDDDEEPKKGTFRRRVFLRSCLLMIQMESQRRRKVKLQISLWDSRSKSKKVQIQVYT